MRTGQYCIWIVRKDTWSPGRHPFNEAALALQDAFADLGYDAPIIYDPREIKGVPIVFGAFLLKRLNAPPGMKMVIYNTEQVHPDSIWFKPGYIETLKRYAVWDYSPLNIENLQKIGVQAALCGIGYAPCLTRIAPAPVKDIDVLFVGIYHPRRAAILDRLHAAGLNVVAVGGGSWAEERDALYARAKIVLNIHMYDAQVLEIVRISYLLANRICVVSESGKDEALEAPLREGVAFADYEYLVETCVALLADDERRARLAETGFQAFSAMDQTAMLERALKTSGLPSR